MIKGIEILNYLKERYEIERANQTEINIIEKELKALKIIKDKDVLPTFVILWELDFYNNVCAPRERLTKEEYDLLKEILQ